MYKYICRYVHTCLCIQYYIYPCIYSFIYPHTCTCTNIYNVCKYLDITFALWETTQNNFFSAVHYYFESIDERKAKNNHYSSRIFFFLWKSWGWEITISIHLISQHLSSANWISHLLLGCTSHHQGRRMVALIPCQPGKPGLQPFHRCPFIRCICLHILACQLAPCKLAGSVHNLRLLASRLQHQCTGF